MGIPLLFFSELLLPLFARLFHIKTDDPILLIAFQSLVYLAMFSLLAVMLRMAYDAPFWKSLGWVSSPVNPGAALFLGVLLAFGIAILGGVLHVENKGSEVTKLLQAPHGIIAIPVFAAVIAPLAEELIFRGFLQPVMIRSIGLAAGIVLTSALFGLLHWQEYAKSWGAAALIGTTGLALGLLRHYSGSTRVSALAHMAYNTTLLTAFFIAQGRIPHT